MGPAHPASCSVRAIQNRSLQLHILTRRAYLTNLVGEAAEDGAAVAAGEPEEERGVAGGAGLGLDEVVEELHAGVRVDLHVPSFTTQYKYNFSLQFQSNRS